MNYENPTPVAVNVVPLINDDHEVVGLLGIERGVEPHVGGLALPGGFVNKMESIEQGAAREFEEETGYHTEPSDWLLLESKITPNNRVLIFCAADFAMHVDEVQNLKLNDEVKGFHVLTKDSKLCFSLHQEILDVYFS